MREDSFPRRTRTVPHHAVFAGVLLMISGVLNVLQGVTAIANDDVARSVGNFSFKFDLTAWGWIHVVVGAAVAFVGWAVYTGATWAKLIGVVIIAVAIAGNFMWLPYEPVWALLLMGIDVVAMWSLMRGPDEVTGRP